MRATSVALILLSLLAGCRAPATDPPPVETPASAAEAEPTAEPAGQVPETIRETKSLKGEFVGFEAGDYLHAVIRQPDGKTSSFFLDRGMEIFLLDHQNQPLELTYQVVDTHVPEAGGTMTIERLSAIQAGEQTFADWWKTAEPSFGGLLAEYQSRIEEATLIPRVQPEELPGEDSDDGEGRSGSLSSLAHSAALPLPPHRLLVLPNGSVRGRSGHARRRPRPPLPGGGAASPPPSRLRRAS